MDKKYIPPVNSIIFTTDDTNPTSTYPGTTWELANNNIYFLTHEEYLKMQKEQSALAVEKPLAWIRVS